GDGGGQRLFGVGRGEAQRRLVGGAGGEFQAVDLGHGQFQAVVHDDAHQFREGGGAVGGNPEGGGVGGHQAGEGVAEALPLAVDGDEGVLLQEDAQAILLG